MQVKFFKQKEINLPYRESLKLAINDLIDGEKSIVNGDYSKNFEIAFSKYIGCKYAVFLSNGLDAISIALKVINIKEGDEILIPNHTYIATWLAALNLGCVIIPVPVKEDSLLIDESKINSLITSKTKAIIPVHLYGNPTNKLQIQDIANKHGLFIIDDAAQAHGANKNLQKVGSFFDMTCFSFYPTKNLGALGEAGCITTNKKEYFEKIKSLANYGKSIHNPIINNYQGLNCRGDELQAAFLISKLKNLDYIIKKRQSIIKIYEKLKTPKLSAKLKLLEYTEGSSPHLAVIKLKNSSLRNDLIKYLSNCNIQTMVHYPIACHNQPFLKKNQIQISNEAARQAEEISNTIISLPISEVHQDHEIYYVVESISRFFESF